jgi:hypothetical protein
MIVTHPILKKVVIACEKQVTLETNALVDGMQSTIQDVKAAVASIAAYKDIIAICEAIQKTED